MLKKSSFEKTHIQKDTIAFTANLKFEIIFDKTKYYEIV